jgi:hypothetical protein
VLVFCVWNCVESLLGVGLFFMNCVKNRKLQWMSGKKEILFWIVCFFVWKDRN